LRAPGRAVTVHLIVSLHNVPTQKKGFSRDEIELCGVEIRPSRLKGESARYILGSCVNLE
jgi:hypothetical protein